MTSRPLTPRRRLLVRGSILLLAVLGLAAGVFVLATVPPTDTSLYPKCTLHSATGLHCPGCGLTRSIHAALTGRFEQAFAYNALAVIIVPYLAFATLESLWSWMWGTPLKPSRLPVGVKRWMPLIIGMVLVLFGVLRNIPIFPFVLLAPHELSP